MVRILGRHQSDKYEEEANPTGEIYSVHDKATQSYLLELC